MTMHFRLQYSMSLWNIKIQITYEFLYLMIVKNLLKCRSQNLRNQIFLALFFENLLTGLINDLDFYISLTN